MGINRTTFLIDKKGKIIKIWENVKVKDHAKEVLETLKIFTKGGSLAVNKKVFKKVMFFYKLSGYRMFFFFSSLISSEI